MPEGLTADQKFERLRDLDMRPTDDGAGIQIELPTSPSVERLQWLGGELQKVIAYLDGHPQRRPSKRAEGSPVYAAGLRDMAAWIFEKVEHDINYQAMRSFLGDAFPNLPVNSSELISKGE